MRAEATAVRAVPQGIEFSVWAAPGSSRSGVRGLHGAALKVAVQAPPEKGKANEEVVRVLAEYFGVPARQIHVLAGMTSRQKRVQVLGLSIEQWRAKVGLRA